MPRPAGFHVSCVDGQPGGVERLRDFLVWSVCSLRMLYGRPSVPMDSGKQVEHQPEISGAHAVQADPAC